MKVAINLDLQSGEVTISIPDRSMGGVKERITISSLDAIQLYQELKKVLA